MAATDSADDPANEVLRLLAEKIKSGGMRAADLFRKIDKDGGGDISASELKEGLKNEINFDVSKEDLALLMSKLDKDGGGDISLKEFDRAIKAAEKLPPPKSKAQIAAEVVEVKKPQGLTQADKDEFKQIFCLFKQLCRTKVEEDGKECLVEWDASGGIRVEELEQLLETVGMKINEEELKAMICEVDEDGNGEIDFQEFCDSMSKRIQVPYSPDEILKSFKAFSRSAPEGMIRVRDLENALKTYMHKDLAANEVQELMEFYKDCFVKLPGHDCEFFNFQDYVDIMAPIGDGSMTAE